MRTAARVVLAAGLCLSGAGPVAAAQTHLVLVRGLAGEEAYAARFHQWAGTLRETALRLGLPDSHIIYLAEDPARDRAAISGPATRDGLAAALRRVAERSPGEATVMLVLLGHGSDRGEPRFSVPGPDLTASDLDTLLAALGTRRVAVVNATSASGGFVPALSAPGRVVVTATRSGFEQNAPTFGGYFVEAFGSPAADLDKDQRVSLLEAFQYARAQVARVYQADGRLLTEHAMLDDNGDGKGSSEPAVAGPDGSLAAAVFLAPPPALVAGLAGDSVAAALERRRAGLEERIAALRTRREEMEPAAYEQALEELLVELAEVTRALRARADGRPPE